MTPRSFGELNGCHHLRQIHVINESGESFYTINSFGGLICFFCIMSHASIRHFPICAYVARATRKRNLTGRRPTLDVAEAGSTRSRRLLRGMHVACRMQTVQKGFRWNTWTGSSVLFLLIYSINFLPHYDGWRRLPSSINFAYVARTRRTIGFNSTSHAPNAVTPWRWRLRGKLRKSSTSVRDGSEPSPARPRTDQRIRLDRVRDESYELRPRPRIESVGYRSRSTN
jgi:hypothetical protein